MPEALREHLAAALEFRVSGRRLTTELRYGQRARDRAEMFAPGSVRTTPTRMNLQHDPMIEVASVERRTLRVADTGDGLRFEADLSGAALDLVRRGRLTGVSPEFYARRERRDAGLRVLEAVDMPEVALVDVGSYSTPLELRAGQLLTAVIPTGHRCSCECAGRDCDAVLFEPGSLDALVDGAADVVAHTGSLKPEALLGSKEAGTLVIERTDNGVNVILTIADTPAAATVRSAAAVSPVHVRPIIDVERSASTVADRVRTYTAAAVTSLLVKTAPPDRRDGWDPAQVADPDPEARARRRLWL